MSSISDENHDAEKCIDGITDGSNMCHTNHEQAPWLALDYGDGVRVSVEKVVLYNTDHNAARTKNIEVRISDQLPASAASTFSGGDLLGTFAGPGTPGQRIEIASGGNWLMKMGRYVIVQMDNDNEPLSLKEVTASLIHPSIKGNGPLGKRPKQFAHTPPSHIERWSKAH